MRKSICWVPKCLLMQGALLLSLSAQAAPQTRIVSYDYDADGVLTQELIEPDDGTLRLETRWTLDTYGNRTAAVVTSRSGSRSSSTGYDANGRFPVSGTNPLNHVEQRQYDARSGAVTQHIDANGLITRWEYDGVGRKTREIRPDGTQTRWDYIVCNGGCPGNNGNSTAFYYVQETPLASDGSTPNGAWRRTYLDVSNRPIRSETQGFNGSDIITVLTQYDVLGRATASTRPFYSGQSAYWTATSYDVLDRTTLITEPNGSQTTTSYNGLKTANTNAQNQTTTKVRNSQNQIVQVIDALGQTLQLAYEPFGNLALTTDVAGNQIFNQYDKLGRKLSTQDPDMGAWNYQYDGFGQLVQQTDAKNQITTFSYDALGRMTRRGEPDLVATWTYDACNKGIGKLCQSSSDNGYSHTLTYDSLGRPVGGNTVLDTTYTVANTFDANGRVASQTYPTGFAVSYSYNAAGYLTEVKNAQSGQRYWQANQMDAEGHLLLQTYGASHVVEQRYTGQTGRIDKILAGAGYSLLNLSYQHDSIGNLTSRTDGNLNVVENFLYDSLNRLTYTQGAGIPTIEYRYNGLGNITYRSDVGNYTYGSSRPHAVTAVAGTVNASFNYDANGNQINGNGRSITVASYNLPTQIQKGGWTDSFLYGPEHQRIKQTNNAGTIYYLNPDNAGGLLYEKEIKADGSVEYKHYLSAAGQTLALYTQRSSGQNDLKYWFKDYQGSLTTITDEAGNVVERLSYEAFGKRRYPNGQPDPASQITGQTTDRGYTGHEHLDEVGLIHMNGRVYDPLLARFVSPDPTVPSAEWMQDFNRYSYVTNNPFMFTDPTGFAGEGENNTDSTGKDTGQTTNTSIAAESTAKAQSDIATAAKAGQVTDAKVDPTTPKSTAAVFDLVAPLGSRQTYEAAQRGDWGPTIGWGSVVVGDIGLTFFTGGLSKTVSAAGKAAIAGEKTLAAAAKVETKVAAKGVVPGEARAFGSLKGVKGDGLTAHHMPQAAAGRTGYNEGGALVMTQTEHEATRTYGSKGVGTLRSDAELSFRDVLAKDIKDVRSIVGSKYNEGLRNLTDYYRSNFSDLMRK